MIRNAQTVLGHGTLLGRGLSLGHGTSLGRGTLLSLGPLFFRLRVGGKERVTYCSSCCIRYSFTTAVCRMAVESDCCTYVSIVSLFFPHPGAVMPFTWMFCVEFATGPPPRKYALFVNTQSAKNVTSSAWNVAQWYTATVWTRWPLTGSFWTGSSAATCVNLER